MQGNIEMATEVVLVLCHYRVVCQVDILQAHAGWCNRGNHYQC